LQRSNSRKYPAAEAAEAALETLVSDGLGSWEAAAASPRGGQPARHFRLHPTHDSTDTTGNGRADADNGPPDTPSDSTPPSSSFSREDQGSVGSVMRRTDSHKADFEGCEVDGFTSGPGVVSDRSVMRDGMEEGEI
jgi:hypothetical protein